MQELTFVTWITHQCPVREYSYKDFGNPLTVAVINKNRFKNEGS